MIIDVREPEEYDRGHVVGSINIPPSELMSGAKQLIEVPKDTEIIVYCVSGARSRTAIQILASMGYTNLINGINQDHVTKNYLA